MAAFEEPAQSEGSAGEATMSHAEGVRIGIWDQGNMEEEYGGWSMAEQSWQESRAGWKRVTIPEQ